MRFSNSFIRRALIGFLLIHSTIALVANQPQVYDQGNKHLSNFSLTLDRMDLFKVALSLYHSPTL